MKTNNIAWHDAKITKAERYKLNNHKSYVLWFTGLSGSGKSTIAMEIERQLYNRNIRTYVLDGDNIRHGLNKDLGFSQKDREENIRRIGEVSKLFVDSGVVSITAFISPYSKDRAIIRSMLSVGEFIEIYLKCGIDICEQRDPKGLYKKARQGEIQGFTGVSDPYEEPIEPELIIETDKQNIQASVQQVLDYLNNHGYLEL
ncbi:adenylyl-sulfate kinase [Bacillus cereus]|uniref:Adenylyl-sulfate kinase n=1 Tax=Bacillus cereus TaxID=1396 RepID=A0A9X8IW32_BACCE|nr:adenylyl-sulfate kinase [Bacillus cereus]RWQ71095.1 adenylyl-sulfate kinase [Bacillus cereus]